MDADRDLIAQSIDRFAERALAPHRDALNHYPDQPLPAGLVAGLGELGLFALGTDEDGAGTLTLALERLGRVSAAAAAIVLAHVLGRELAHLAGHERSLAPTEVCAFPAYHEPGAVDDGIELGGSASSRPVLDGTARFVVNAPIAGALILPVRDRDRAGAPALVVLTPGQAGVSVGPPLWTLGMRGCPVADVCCHGAPLDPARLLAAPPEAARLVATAYARLYGPVAGLLGAITERSLAVAVDYARERYQGGCNIIDHQQVRAMLADMAADHMLCRQAAATLAARALSGPAAAALLLRAKEAASRATSDGVQLLGGYGYMEDYAEEQCMRDARQGQGLLGRVDSLRQELVAEWLAAGARTETLAREVAP